MCIFSQELMWKCTFLKVTLSDYTLVSFLFDGCEHLWVVLFSMVKAIFKAFSQIKFFPLRSTKHTEQQQMFLMNIFHIFLSRKEISAIGAFQLQ